MGFEGLKNIKVETNISAVTIKNTIQKLRSLSYEKIKHPRDVKAITREIIRAVDRLLLVKVDEGELQKRKLKKDKMKPITYSDDDIWIGVATMRNDFDTRRWEKNIPKGYIWYTKEGEILGTIYKTRGHDQYRVYIDKAIADNPVGASILIKAMKSKISNTHHI